MPQYKYRAKKGPEDIVEGTIEAQSEPEAVEKISELGYLPIRITLDEHPSERQRSAVSHKPIGRIRSGEITIFSRQLASLLKAGVPILNGLGIIAEQSENVNLKRVLDDMGNSIKDGSTLSSTIMQYPKVFPPLYIAMIRTGEDSGALPEVLLRIAEYRAKQEEMFSRFRMAMAYPILMAMVGIGTVVFMLTFVMPRLMKLFVNMEQELPLPTRILISISQSLQKWWYWLIIILLLAIAIIKREAATKAGKISMSLLKLHMPIFGKVMIKADLACFSRTLELLVKSGVTILKAIDIAIPVLDNEIIKSQLRQSYKELEQGGSFGRSLKKSKLFPIFMTNLIIVGEESGKLDEALAEVADSYERDTDEAMKVAASLLEPLMILVMGLIVGFIVVSMLLPVFEINVMVK